MRDERIVDGFGGRECGDGFGGTVGKLLRKCPDGLQFMRADPAAAHHEAVLGRVEPPVERLDVGARQRVVEAFVGRDAVGVPGAEEGPGKGFAGLDVDLRAVDGEPLFAFGGVGPQLRLGEGRAEQDLRGDVERSVEEFRERGEVDVGVVAVDVHVVPRAVVVELFGDLPGAPAVGTFGQEVCGRRGREGRRLHGRAGTEDERDAQHLEIRRRERVEGDAVAEDPFFGLLDVDFRWGDAGRCHFFAR